jgi:hypothetical protein
VSPKAIKELKEIIARDSGISIDDDQANELGVALLRLTRVSVAALARADERKVDQNKTVNENGEDKV